MRTLVERIARLALACTIMLLAATANGAEPNANESTLAVWKPQRLVFTYRSEGRHYSCSLLEHKIEMILQRLGADERIELTRFSCHDLAGLARFEVSMRSPVEASEENVRALTDYDTKDRLVARVHGTELPSAGEIETFPAVWASVSFRTFDLDAGDCALLQQLRRKIVPKMSVRVTKDIRGVDCSQELRGGPGPRLTVLALVPQKERTRH